MTRRLFSMTFVTNEITGLYLLRVDRDDFGGINFRTFYSSGQLMLSCPRRFSIALRRRGAVFSVSLHRYG